MKHVLIFDSGVGGLSVYQEIARLMPLQNYIYAFDNAGFPYGELADHVLIERVCAMIKGISEHYPLALIVIACNTASTLVLPPLRSLFDIPIVGVVPAIKPAAYASKTKRIALLATPATVRRDYTYKLIKEFAPHCQVDLIGSTDLVYLAEEKLRGAVISPEALSPILNLLNSQVDHLVLGCTHFPLLKDELAACLPKSCLLVDSGKAIAKRVKNLLQLEEEKSGSDKTKRLTHHVLSSAPVNGERALNQRLLAFGFNSITRAPTF